MDNLTKQLNEVYEKFTEDCGPLYKIIHNEWEKVDIENEEQCKRIETLTKAADLIVEALDLMCEYL